MSKEGEELLVLLREANKAPLHYVLEWVGRLLEEVRELKEEIKELKEDGEIQ